MRVVLQRVKECNVKVDNKIVGEISQGFLLLDKIHRHLVLQFLNHNYFEKLL